MYIQQLYTNCLAEAAYYIVLKDEKGGMSKITIADVNQSNGVIHVIDTVVMGK